jgi:hemolysin activation/secretion protein
MQFSLHGNYNSAKQQFHKITKSSVVSKPFLKIYIASSYYSSAIIVFGLSALPSIAYSNETQHPITTQPNSPHLLAQATPTLPRPDFQRTVPIPTEVPLPILPPPEELIPSIPSIQPSVPNADFSTQITVKNFEVAGSTVFTTAELTKITAPFTNKSIGFAQLLQVANQITELYASKGYINSGAFIVGNQTFRAQDSTVKIQVIEGRVEDIVVTGTQRLNPNYIKSRIGLGANSPLKLDQLIESLRILQQDPLIKSISTELAAGKAPNANVVNLKVTENPTWRAGINIANNRTPSVGEIQAQATLSQSNLTGSGDTLAVSYGRSEASNVYDINYTLPINPQNGTIKLQYSRSNSRVIETPFDQLDINGSSQDLSISYRQPLIQTTSQEFALGLTVNKRATNTGYLASVIGERVGYPSPGADENGNTRITAVRFSQDYTTRDTKQVFAARSQLSLGVNAFSPTVAASPPDSNFVAWRGQAQYVRSLSPNSIAVFKIEGQLADRPLVALEQIGIGGQDTVRGYRQDLLLSDNGLIASAEVRVPIFATADNRQTIQIVPFLDLGIAWNNSPSPTLPNSTIASGGLSLRYQSGDSFFAKVDYGIPFNTINQSRRTGQEQGLHASVGFSQSF